MEMTNDGRLATAVDRFVEGTAYVAEMPDSPGRRLALAHLEQAGLVLRTTAALLGVDELEGFHHKVVFGTRVPA